MGNLEDNIRGVRLRAQGIGLREKEGLFTLSLEPQALCHSFEDNISINKAHI